MTTTPNPGGAWAGAAFKPAPKVFRFPFSVRLVSLIASIILVVVTVIMVGFAAFGFTLNWALGLFMLAVAAFMVALCVYVLRDLRGKWGLRLTLGQDAVTLALPSGRSLIHRPPPQHTTIPYKDIASIETRLEAYGSLGLEIMQRAYVLHRKSGELIFLFEERALATAFASSTFSAIATELAARAGVALKGLGMAEGRGGLLCAWGAAVSCVLGVCTPPIGLCPRCHRNGRGNCGHAPALPVQSQPRPSPPCRAYGPAGSGDGVPDRSRRRLDDDACAKRDLYLRSSVTARRRTASAPYRRYGKRRSVAQVRG